MAAVNQIRDLFDHTINWDWESKHVSQSFLNSQGVIQNTSVADIIDSGTVLIAAGPADLDAAMLGPPGGIRIVPLGLVESASIQQSRQLSTIFELGSKLRYMVPGRNVIGMMINRVLFDGDNLLKVLYGGEVLQDGANTKNKIVQFTSDRRPNEAEVKKQLFSLIGSGHMGMNLGSGFFNQPFGLAFYFKDSQNDLISEMYYEGCQISTHSFALSAGANVLAESVSLECVRARPIVTVNSDSQTADQLSDSDIVGNDGWDLSIAA
jgi:hypothetical protein